ncbi:hypothetical protein [Natrinema sp. DC36]|uniref:hypothetical protein n=1 Tax=Natrinema sp. DC36 TaxID=2878680 RepID=UPI001CEFF09F|nr:hypothetical protein [Natrinema sp. DC36]
MQELPLNALQQDDSDGKAGGKDDWETGWRYGERVIDEMVGDQDTDWGELEQEVENEAKERIEYRESKVIGGSYQDSEALRVKVDTLQQRVSTLEVIIENEMASDTATIDVTEFRTFLGLSSLASVAFLLLFLMMFSADILPVALVAGLTVLLFLSALGFGRLWYDLSGY